MRKIRDLRKKHKTVFFVIELSEETFLEFHLKRSTTGIKIELFEMLKIFDIRGNYKTHIFCVCWPKKYTKCRIISKNRSDFEIPSLNNKKFVSKLQRI